MATPDAPKLGAVFPQLDIGADRTAIRHWVDQVESLGITHILGYDHVLGGDRSAHPERSLYYGHEDTFHEVFVLFGFLAAVTDLELVTAVTILPQRQTALVAKQATEVDILTGGNFRFGVGIGWNDLEYQGLGVPFSGRGARMDEQVEVLRALWTNPVVDIDGDFHRISHSGIAPLPIQRPIPIWMGTRPRSPALKRIGRVADGVILQTPPGPELDELLATIRHWAAHFGRDSDSIGIQANVHLADGDVDRVRREIDGYLAVGAQYIAFDTMLAGLADLDRHIEALETMVSIARRASG